MPRKRTWGSEYSDQQVFDIITAKLEQNMIWKDISADFGVPEKNLSTIWSWYNRNKDKYARIQTIHASPTQLVSPLPSGGVPPPPPSEVLPPPPPPKGVTAVELTKSDEITEEDYLLKKIEYNTKRSRRRYGSPSQKDESVASVVELQDLQSELFSRLQLASPVA